MIKDLVLMDYAAVMLTICLLSFIITNDYFAKRTRELFLRACFLLLVLVVADSIEYWTATFNHFSILRVWMSAIGYSLRPAIIYVIISLMNSREKSKKWMLVPIVINAFIAFSVLFTDVAYSYTVCSWTYRIFRLCNKRDLPGGAFHIYLSDVSHIGYLGNVCDSRSYGNVDHFCHLRVGFEVRRYD